MRASTVGRSGLGTLVALATITGLASIGCGGTCLSSDRQYEGGVIHRGDSLLVYESSAIDGPLLPFDGAVTYHIHHKLGARPFAVRTFLAFSKSPERPGGGGWAQGAGNQAVISRTTEDEVVVRNDSCSSYYLRVVIEATPPGK